MGGDTLKKHENVHELTPEVPKGFSLTRFTGEKVKHVDGVLKFNKFIKVLGYTGKGDKCTKRKTFVINDFPRRVAKIEAQILDESDVLQGEGLKFFSL